MLKEFNRSQGKYSLITNYIEHIEDQPSVSALKEILLTKNYPDFDKFIVEECKAIEENKKILEPGFVNKGIYYPQIKRYFELFDRNQILIIESEELKDNKKKMLKEISSFLSVDEFNLEKINLNNRDKRSYGNKISVNAYNHLKQFYAPYNEKLFDLISKRYNWD